ncbi:MAG: cupin domain-containing protein [Ignavibacteria bacterium]|nr:cupin domain-containing protein [Ignavibacteria bacterium]
MNPQAEKIISILKLKKHFEGGYYSEIYRSKEFVKNLPDRYKGNHVHYTSIYFLLNENDFSAFHILKSDEIWHFYDGTSLDIHVINKDGTKETITLGNNISEGEKYMHLVEGGCYFAAEVRDKTSFALVGCTVAPGFEFEDFEMPSREFLLKKFPRHEELIERLSRTWNS